MNDLTDQFDQLRAMEGRVSGEYIRKLLVRLSPIEEKLVLIVIEMDDDMCPVVDLGERFNLTQEEIESHLQSALQKLNGKTPKKMHISLQKAVHLLRTKRAAN